MIRFKNYIINILKSWCVNKELANQIKVNINIDTNYIKILEEKISKLQEDLTIKG